MPGPSDDVTELLTSLSAGDALAGEKLFSVVYEKLHAIAHAAMLNERPGHTLQTTALIHEAYLRLVRKPEEGWSNRQHFFSTAASAMRRILVDEARRRQAARRGAGRRPVSLNEVGEAESGAQADTPSFDNLDALDKALDKLASEEEHKRKCTMVELRFFAGFTLEQTAELLNVSLATVKRDWEFTKAWLGREMVQAKP
ncbi:MAG: ECF-type sigma factor [Planctomycetota bacterium]